LKYAHRHFSPSSKRESSVLGSGNNMHLIGASPHLYYYYYFYRQIVSGNEHRCAASNRKTQSTRLPPLVLGQCNSCEFILLFFPATPLDSTGPLPHNPCLHTCTHACTILKALPQRGSCSLSSKLSHKEAHVLPPIPCLPALFSPDRGCCICLEAMPLAQLRALVPCGHRCVSLCVCVCVEVCRAQHAISTRASIQALIPQTRSSVG
jgi:hypothetical protein